MTRSHDLLYLCYYTILYVTIFFLNINFEKGLPQKLSNYPNGLLSLANKDLLRHCPSGPKSTFLKGTRKMV